MQNGFVVTGTLILFVTWIALSIAMVVGGVLGMIPDFPWWVDLGVPLLAVVGVGLVRKWWKGIK